MITHQRFATTLAVCALVCISASATATPEEASALAAPDTATQARLVAAYGKLPLVFEANQGQADASARFIARGSGYRMFLTADSAVMSLSPTLSHRSGEQDASTRNVDIRIRFVGARHSSPISGEAPLQSHSNYFIGNDPAHYVTDVPHFAQVRYAELYSGTDLVFYGNQRQLEFDFVLGPGADPTQIALAFDGADEVVVDDNGDLILRTPLGAITQQRPNIYQNLGGRRQPIEGRYERRPDNTIGVRVAAYDSSQPLVIDPVLSYATFVGGSSDDFGTAIAVDASGNAYIAGYTFSTNFPASNAYQKSLARKAVTNIFVTKLNASGSGLVYSTYLGGGSEIEYATGIAIDAAGSAYITGTTTGSSFPTTTGAYQTGATGGGSFVSKLGPAGNTLAYSTYVLKASATGIAVDSANSAYITGTAVSGFAATAGALQTTTHSASSTNAFVLKLNLTGTAASYATFLGGAATDVARGIAVDASGNAYIGGWTTSTDFPVANALQPASKGLRDGFVAKLNASGSALVYSTYLGGEDNDSIYAIAVDQAGNAYVAGDTYSSAFPVTPFAFEQEKAGYYWVTNEGQGFVTKLAPSGDALVYSTYVGSNLCGYYSCSFYNIPPETSVNAIYGIAVDSAGHAYVTGLSYSLAFPLVDSLVPQFPPWGDGLFVAKLSQVGNALLYSTFVKTSTRTYATNSNTPAGLPYDAGKGIAVDSSGNAYGVSDGGSEFSATAGAFQTTIAGGTDATVFKLSNSSGQVLLSASANPATAYTATQLTATVAGGGSSGSVTFLDYVSGWGATRTLATVALNNGTATFSTSVLDPGLNFISAVYRNGNANVADSPPLILIVNSPTVCN
jgi:Beta-propeller repeat